MADTGIRGEGDTVVEAFIMGATALTGVITDPSLVDGSSKIHITCRAAGIEYLFFDWINTLIYEMDVRKMLFSSFDLTITRGKELMLEAEVWGENIKKEKHHPAVLIKGATMTELVVENLGDRWVAQCVVDV